MKHTQHHHGSQLSLAYNPSLCTYRRALCQLPLSVPSSPSDNLDAFHASMQQIKTKKARIIFTDPMHASFSSASAVQHLPAGLLFSFVIPSLPHKSQSIKYHKGPRTSLPPPLSTSNGGPPSGPPPTWDGHPHSANCPIKPPGPTGVPQRSCDRRRKKKNQRQRSTQEGERKKWPFLQPPATGL